MKSVKLIGWVLVVILALFVIIGIQFYTPDIPVETLKAKYMTDASRFIEVDGMQVHYRDEGDPSDSIPLVLIHGTSSSLMTWDEMIKGLGNKRIVRFDLPAFALTGPNTFHDYSMDYYVWFVEQLLSQLKVNHCYMAGNSLGGGITWQYALAHPGQVQKMILIDATGYPIDYAKGSLGFTLGKIPVVKQLMTFITPKAMVKKSLMDVYGDKSKVTDELVDIYYDMTCREGNRDALIVRLNQQYIDRSKLIEKTKTPALIIWGELDQLDPLEYAHKFDEDLPNSELIVLKDIGHVPLEEAPEIVGPLIGDFIGVFQ